MCNNIDLIDIRDLNNINLDNAFDENDLDTISHIRLSAWDIKFEKLEALKNGK